MGLSISHLLIILLIILVLFGAGKLPQVMSELGKGVKALRDGMKSDANEEKGKKKKKMMMICKMIYKMII